MTPSSPTMPHPSPTSDLDDSAPVCVLCFNANDPSGMGGLTADACTVASVGAHPLAVCTGVYVRDTRSIQGFVPLDADAISDQARTVLEDIADVQVFKVGFLGSPEAIGVVAELATDYDSIPLIAYMPDLSWWQDEAIEDYLDAFRELLLPQASVLVGHHSTLWRWLLPDWSSERSPSARDLARAAGEMGVPYTLVTGIPLPEQFVENQLATPEAVVASGKFELFDATFAGAGDTLSAALAALVAAGHDLGEALGEALNYLDGCLDAGFRPGMGHHVPDRLFWAQPDLDEAGGKDHGPKSPSSDDPPPSPEGFVIAPRTPHDTQH